jgi:hypothetical protein
MQPPKKKTKEQIEAERLAAEAEAEAARKGEFVDSIGWLAV